MFLIKAHITVAIQVFCTPAKFNAININVNTKSEGPEVSSMFQYLFQREKGPGSINPISVINHMIYILVHYLFFVSSSISVLSVLCVVKYFTVVSVCLPVLHHCDCEVVCIHNDINVSLTLQNILPAASVSNLNKP